MTTNTASSLDNDAIELAAIPSLGAAMSAQSSATDPPDHPTNSQIAGEEQDRKSLTKLAMEDGATIGRDSYGLMDQTNRLPPLQIAFVFFTLGICVMITILESTFISTSLSAISSDLKAGTKSSWIITCYLVTQCALLPCWSRLSDIVGRKVLFNAMLFEFLIASLGCALAKNITTLLAFRGLQGIGGGAVLVVAQAISLDVVTIRQRIIFEVCTAVGNAAGPVLGGVLAEINWRLIFYIFLPLAGGALVLSFFLIPSIPVTGSWKVKMKQIDFVGGGLAALASVLMLLALSWGGVEYPWTSPIVLCTLLAGAGVYVAFCFWEGKGAAIPIVPMRLFKNPTVVAVVTFTFLANGLVSNLLIFYGPQFLQLVRNMSAARSGVYLMAYLVPLTVGVFVCAIVTVKTGRVREMILFGLATHAVAVGLISTLNEGTSNDKIVGYLFFAGAALGPTFQTGMIAAQAAVEKRDLTVVTGTRIFARQIGGLFGVAIASTLVNNQVARAPISKETIRTVLDNPAHLRTLLDAPTAQLVLLYYRRGFKQVFLVAAILSAVAFVVAAAFCKHHVLDNGENDMVKAQPSPVVADEEMSIGDGKPGRVG